MTRVRRGRGSRSTRGCSQLGVPRVLPEYVGETEAPAPGGDGSAAEGGGVRRVRRGVVAEVLGVALSWVSRECSRSMWGRRKRRR